MDEPLFLRMDLPSNATLPAIARAIRVSNTFGVDSVAFTISSQNALAIARLIDSKTDDPPVRVIEVPAQGTSMTVHAWYAFFVAGSVAEQSINLLTAWGLL